MNDPYAIWAAHGEKFFIESYAQTYEEAEAKAKKLLRVMCGQFNLKANNAEPVRKLTATQVHWEWDIPPAVVGITRFPDQ